MSARPLDVAGIGSMVVDRVHRAPRLLSSDAKALLRDVEGAGPMRAHVGGVVLNHLGWAAALGLRAGIFGRQGDDPEGRFLRAAMDRIGIERDLRIVAEPTSVAEIFVDDAGGRAIYMAPGATSGTRPEHVREDHAETIQRAARITTEVSQLPLAAAREALAVAREAGVPTVVDLDLSPRDALAELGDEAALDAVLRGADLLKPGKEAARELFPDLDPDPLNLARAVRERFANAAVVVTDGAAGCAVAADDFEGFVPACAVKPVDTTGAGDAFLGGLLTALHHGVGWSDAARLANACGAACAEKLGAFPDEPEGARARVLELYDGTPLALGSPSTGQATVLAEALASFDVAVEELAALRGRVDFGPALSLLRETRTHGGRVHVTGVGKPEHVARYAAGLFSSTGTPAHFLHATEAVHGSAGQVVAGDVVVAISNSGETHELLAALAAVRRLGVRVLAVTGAPDSALARGADAVLEAGVVREGGPLGFAPRASVAAEIVALASLSAALEREVDLSRADYNLRHPGGSLGQQSEE